MSLAGDSGVSPCAVKTLLVNSMTIHDYYHCESSTKINDIKAGLEEDFQVNLDSFKLLFDYLFKLIRLVI